MATAVVNLAGSATVQITAQDPQSAVADLTPFGTLVGLAQDPKTGQSAISGSATLSGAYGDTSQSDISGSATLSVTVSPNSQADITISSSATVQGTSIEGVFAHLIGQATVTPNALADRLGIAPISGQASLVANLILNELSSPDLKKPVIKVKSLIMVPETASLQTMTLTVLIKPNYSSQALDNRRCLIIMEMTGSSFSFLSERTVISRDDEDWTEIVYTVPSLSEATEYILTVHAGIIIDTNSANPFSSGDSFEGSFNTKDSFFSGTIKVGDGFSTDELLPYAFRQTSLAKFFTTLLDLIVGEHYEAAQLSTRDMYNERAFLFDTDNFLKIMNMEEVFANTSSSDLKAIIPYISSILDNKSTPISYTQLFRGVGLNVSIFGPHDMNNDPELRNFVGFDIDDCTIVAIIDNIVGNPSDYDTEIQAVMGLLRWVCVKETKLFFRLLLGDEQVPVDLTEDFESSRDDTITDDVNWYLRHPWLPDGYGLVLYADSNNEGTYFDDPSFDPGSYDVDTDTVIWGTYDYDDYLAETIPANVLSSTVCGPSVIFEHWVQMLKTFEDNAPIDDEWKIFLNGLKVYNTQLVEEFSIEEVI